MESQGPMLLWSTSGPNIDHPSAHSVGHFNMDGRPISQPEGHPRPAATLVQVCADVKPRLTKDQHEILERHFQAQPKPSTNTKKGFADALGVSLDKINNWFQNRRAKVKQDHKKQVNAIQLFQATLAQHSQHYLGHPQPVPSPLPQYYGPLPVLPSSSDTPKDLTGTSSFVRIDSHQQDDFTDSRLDSMDPRAHNETPSSHPRFAMQTSAPEVMQFSGPQFSEPQFAFSGAEYDGSFEAFDVSGMAEPFNFNQFMPPPRMNTAPDASAFGPSSASASPHTIPVSFPHVQQVGNERQLVFAIESPEAATDSSNNTCQNTPAESTSTWCSNTQLQELYQQRNVSGPIFQLDQDSPVPTVEEQIRRTSSTAELADSMNNVDIDQSSEGRLSFPPSSQPSGLAARRQKPRPANLGPACIRSTSYSSGMPTSPGATPNDQALRRIRSHGITNVGRVSKFSGQQKSPMLATFEQAAAVANSPKFARHGPNFSVSTNSSSGPLTATTAPGSLAPPTPCTPHEFGRFPYWQAPGTGKFTMFNDSPGAFSHHGDDAAYGNTSSPLLAAVDFQHEHQHPAYQTRRQTPPQSAPATQLNFPGSAHGLPSTQMMQLSDKSGSHIRRPSLPQHNLQPQAQYHTGPYLDPQVNAQMHYNAPAPQAFHAMAVPYTMDSFGPVMAASDMHTPTTGFDAPYQIVYTEPQPQLTFSNHGPEDFHNGVLKKQ